MSLTRNVVNHQQSYSNELMDIRGAGGSEGGIGRFFLGLIMFVGGGYLLLNAIQVTNSFHLGYGLFSVGSLVITSGYVLVPFMLGVGMVFFDARSYLGWLMVLASVTMLVFGVVTSVHFNLRAMSAFELLTILTLTTGGLGLFLSSLRSSSR